MLTVVYSRLVVIEAVEESETESDETLVFEEDGFERVQMEGDLELGDEAHDYWDI